MTVREVIDELNKVKNDSLQVVVLNDSILLSSVNDVFEDSLVFDDNDSINKCIRIK